MSDTAAPSLINPPLPTTAMRASTVKTLLIAVAAAAALIGAAMLAVPSAGEGALPCVSRCLGF